jgi:hypothetical protein
MHGRPFADLALSAGTTPWSVLGAADIRRRSLDGFVLSQDTTLYIVLGAAVLLILWIVVRALRAEQKREQRESKERPRTEPPPSSN